jgi:hypothetical protein
MKYSNVDYIMLIWRYRSPKWKVLVMHMMGITKLESVSDAHDGVDEYNGEVWCE